MKWRTNYKRPHIYCKLASWSRLNIFRTAPSVGHSFPFPLLRSPLSCLSFIIWWMTWLVPPTHPPPVFTSVFILLLLGGAEVRVRGQLPGLTTEPCSVLSFFFFLPDNSVPQEQEWTASAARSVHTDCTFSECRPVSHFHRTLFIRPVARLL